MTLDWTESGGPAVQPPARRGFGTTLIERAMTARVRCQSEPGVSDGPGLRCTFAIPLTKEFGEVAPAATRTRSNDGDR